MTHCSECGRKIRIKVIPGGLGGNVGSHPRLRSTDWLGHSKSPMCHRYGLPPDAVETTQAQRYALLWLAGEDVPAWYDSAHLTTLKALERRALVGWTADGIRCYWVTPEDNYLDHWYPCLTDEGQALVNTWGC